MPTYAYTVLDPIPPVSGSPATGYVVVDESGHELLDYGTTVLPGIVPAYGLPATDYTLAFSTTPPTPRPTIGQLWPRGAGQA